MIHLSRSEMKLVREWAEEHLRACQQQSKGWDLVEKRDPNCLGKREIAAKERRKLRRAEALRSKLQ